jgi:hypothetical protein
VSTHPSLSDHRRRWRVRWSALTAPTSDGLPCALVVWAFPLLVLAAMVILVGLSINGSSTGVYWSYFGRGPDPDLIAGMPRPIRSDEWMVQSGWVVSQVSQGFPITNTVFPGGTDATVMNDLPAWDWSNLFRPHTWGFLLLGLDHGMAVRWWLPAAALLVTIYWFVVTVLPRRPLLAATMALVAVLQPIVQWWWLPIVPLPVAFAFATATAALWATRSSKPVGRILTALLAGYLAIAMAMSIYVPFMLPAILAATFFVLGHLLNEWRSGTKPATIARRLAPLAASAVAAGAVLGTWIATRRETVDALLSTVYPGQRLTPTGTGTDADLLSLASAPLQRSLQIDELVPWFGANASEASSALLVSLFLLPALGATAVTQWRRERRLDWLVLSLGAVQLVVLAFLFVPGWDGLAHLVGMDRAVPHRTRLIFVILAVMTVTILIARLDHRGARVGWIPTVASGSLALASCVWVWARLDDLGSPAVPSTWSVIACVALVVSVVAFARRAVLIGGVAILGASVAIGSGVNPLYHGVFDLREQTKAGRTVMRIAAEEPDAAWVGIGSFVSMSTLVESGVRAYSGVQTYPTDVMWQQIDPDGSNAENWNRLAHVSWTSGTGDPNPRQPPTGQADVIEVTFDPCGDFAQAYVNYVLVDGAPLPPPCTEIVRRIKQNDARQWIYRIVPPT